MAFRLDAADDTVDLFPTNGGGAYGVKVDIGDDSYDVIFDTGSSDLWVFHDGVECINSQGNQVSDSVCNFGPEFAGSFDEGTVSDEHFVSTLQDKAFILS